MQLQYDKTYFRRDGFRAGPLHYDVEGFFVTGTGVEDKWFNDGKAVCGNRGVDLVKLAPDLIVPGDSGAGCLCYPTSNSILGGMRVTSLNPECPFHGKIMKSIRYETPQEEVKNLTGKVIFLAGPTVRGHQQHLQPSWRFEAERIFSEMNFDGTIIVPEFTSLTESDKGRYDLPQWENEGLRRAFYQ